MRTQLVEFQDTFYQPPNIDFILFASIYFGTISLIFSIFVYFYNSPFFEIFFDFMDSFHSSSSDQSDDRCYCRSDNAGEFPELQRILPGNYRYAVCYFETTNPRHFECAFRVNISTKESTLKWIEEFKRSSGVAYKKKRSFAENTDRHVFKIVLTSSKKNCCRPEGPFSTCSKQLFVTLERADVNGNNEDPLIHEEGFPLRVSCRHKYIRTRTSAGARACHSASGLSEGPSPTPQNAPKSSKATAARRTEDQNAQQTQNDGCSGPFRELLEVLASLEQDLQTKAAEAFGCRFKYRDCGMVDITSFRDFAARTRAEFLKNIADGPRRDALLRNFDAIMAEDFGSAIGANLGIILPPENLPPGAAGIEPALYRGNDEDDHFFLLEED